MEQALKELEEIRDWVRSQNQEQLSYKVRIAPHTLRMFSNKRVFCPSFKIIRTLQLYMNGTQEK